MNIYVVQVYVSGDFDYTRVFSSKEGAVRFLLGWGKIQSYIMTDYDDYVLDCRSDDIKPKDFYDWVLAVEFFEDEGIMIFESTLGD